MKVNILLFGIIKEIIGKPEVSYEIADNLRVDELKQQISQDYPELNNLNSVLIAVNNEYASDERMLQEKDEIALIPPVSGG